MTLAVLTLFMTPLLTLVLAFDGPSRDLGGTGLLFVARASRGALGVGRAVAAWGAFCAAVLALYVPVTILTVRQGHASPGSVLSFAALFYAATAVTAAAYVSLWSLVGSMVRSTSFSLAIGLCVALVLGLVRGALHLEMPETRWLYVLPGSLDEVFLSGRRDLMAVAVGVAGVWFLAMALAASSSFQRRS